MNGRPRITDLCAAEWTKLWSLRSTPLALGLGMALALYVVGRGAAQGVDTATFTGPLWALLMVGTGMFGAQSLVGEHSSGLIRATLLAVPDRRRLVMAKALVVAGILAVAALVLAVGGLALAHTVEPGRYGADGDLPRAIGASALVLPVCALAGLAAGALVRHAAAAGFVVCTALGFGPLLLRPDGNHIATDLANILPYYSWGRLAAAGTGSSGTMSAAAAWSTLAAWAAVSLLVTVVVMDRRDV